MARWPWGVIIENGIVTRKRPVPLGNDGLPMPVNLTAGQKLELLRVEDINRVQEGWKTTDGGVTFSAP